MTMTKMTTRPGRDDEVTPEDIELIEAALEDPYIDDILPTTNPGSFDDDE